MKVLGPLVQRARQFAGASPPASWRAERRRAQAEQVKAARRQEKQRQSEALAARQAARAAAKQRLEERRARRTQQREAERIAVETTAAHAYARYLEVREWARDARRDNGGGTGPLSGCEREMIAGLAHLWDAEPATIATLRRACDPLSDIRASAYDGPSGPPDALSVPLRRELQVLRKQMGSELFVQEPSALGGFGVVRNGERYNEDTLKFYRALAALHDGAVLAPFRAGRTRSLVWEIGGGWGGFAYQFKTVCPNVTYLITGLPEALLVSAVYLMSVMPAARCRLYTEAGAGELWSAWQDVDFIFAPESALATLRPPRIEMTLDITSLRTMEAERVWTHVQRAYEFGSRYFYSVLPGAHAADEAANVWGAIARRFWPHPVPPRGVEGVAFPPTRAAEHAYVHLVGWSRIRP